MRSLSKDEELDSSWSVGLPQFDSMLDTIADLIYGHGTESMEFIGFVNGLDNFVNGLIKLQASDPLMNFKHQIQKI